MEAGLGSREEWGQESINLKEVYLYANFEACLHVIGNAPVKKKIIMQEEIEKLQKKFWNGIINEF